MERRMTLTFNISLWLTRLSLVSSAMLICSSINLPISVKQAGGTLYLSEFLVCSISLCKLSMAPLCLFLKSEMSEWTELNRSSLSTMAAMLEAVLLNSCL